MKKLIAVLRTSAARRDVLTDATGVAGAGCIVVGASLIAAALGWIVAGLLLVAAAFLASRAPAKPEAE